MLAGSAVATTLPILGAPAITKNRTDFKTSLDGIDPGEEKYWEMVKKQFTIKEDLIMVNAANLCPSPYFVNQQVSVSLNHLEQDVSFQYREKFNAEREAALNSLAHFLGISTKEIGITRNTSESNNIIVHGLDLKKGDEVVLWDQNHPTNGIAWEEQAKRYGFTVKWVQLPAQPKSQQELIEPFEEAISSKTKLVSFSHISNVSGIALPVKEICTLARSKGVFSMVDGAQSFGFMDLDLKSVGCDFYTGSITCSF